MFGRSKQVQSHAGELSIPPQAVSQPDSSEIIRFWIADGRGYVTLNSQGHAMPETGDSATFWGILLADLAQHMVEATRLQSEGERSSDSTMTRLTKVFLDELGFSKGVTGSLHNKDEG